MADLKRALRAELQSLERKMAKIRALLDEYDDDAAPSEPSPAVGTARGRSFAIGVAASPLNPRGQAKSLTTQILDAAAAHLRVTGQRAATSELTKACVEAGVPLPGDLQKQRDYVSSVLSHSPAFNNVRGQGYGLADWPTEGPASGHGADVEAAPDDGPQRMLLAPAQPNGALHAND